MPLPLTNLRDCTEKCKSKQHGKLITAALTKRSISDSDLCSYLDYVCCCCDTVKDNAGQSALHMSVSCGRTNVVKWLTKSRRANINLRDFESGFTPLHKSVFYGKIDITVQLIRLGANLASLDYDGYTVLENAMLDLTEWKELAKEFNPPCSEGFDPPLEIYAWGSNANYTFGPQQERVLPERLDIFHKHNPGANVRQICLEKFHCVILTTSGEVFASGHGHGGRLGFESGQTVLAPEKVTFPTRLHHTEDGIIKEVSISVDHSIFLSSSGHVWTCGQNAHCVLGINPPPPCVLKPHQLPATQYPLDNVLAAKYHSIAWGESALYTWGLNGGQLGHHVSAGKYIITPKVVPNFLHLTCLIRDVASSNAAIAVLTSNFDVYLLHQYTCSKVTVNHLSIRTFGITGGKISAKIDHNESIEESQELVIVINNTLDHLYVWSESTPIFTRCIFSGNRCFKVTQLTLSLNEILFITNFGEAYRASFKSKIKINNIESENALLVRKNNVNKILNNNTYQVLKVTKIPHIHRALSIHSDIEGKNFSCLRNSNRTEVSFPHPFHIVDSLIEYLYTDSLSNLNKKDLDYLSNLLVLADEFFLEHLKDLCEDALISHISLKSVATIFSFSHIYNAIHLRTCCMRFICYNLPAILESKCLEVVHDELLQELTYYYDDFNQKLQQRIITPYMDAPSDEIISEIAKSNPIKLNSGSENYIKAIAKHRRKRLLPRKSSSSEFVLQNKTDLSKKDETLPEISNLSLSEIEASPNPKEEPFSKVQMRVKALVTAREIIGLEDDQSHFEKLAPKSEFSLANFPELMDHSPSTKSSHKGEKVDFKQKMSKLSQKQRKRLSSESNLSGPELSTSPASETPKNPWKIIAPTVCTNNDVFGNLEPVLTIDSIITAEIKQKENFIKMKTKRLAHTQIEDKAIDDLKKFYNVDNVSDEVITVNRIQTGLLASPVWVPIKK